MTTAQCLPWKEIGRGSFQGYTLGTVFSAQLESAMVTELDASLEELVEARRFEEMRQWMEDNVHQHGKRYPTDELVEVATGEPLTAEYFLDRIESKYGELYRL